jgi:ketosteroid isomerase-like protein
VIGSPELDLANVVAEVRAAFARYEQALVAGDVAVLNELFWASVSTVRFGLADRQEGHDEISRWRKSQPALVGRRLSETRVTALGPDVAIVTTLFSYPGRPIEGRQSQTWFRGASGWRIACAHVSEIPAAPGAPAAPKGTAGR